MSTIQLSLSTWGNLVLIFRVYLPPSHTHAHTHTQITPIHVGSGWNPVSPNSIIAPSSLCSNSQLPWDFSRCVSSHLTRAPFLSQLYSLKDFLTLAPSDKAVKRNHCFSSFPTMLIPFWVQPHPWQGPPSLLHLIIYRKLWWLRNFCSSEFTGQRCEKGRKEGQREGRREGRKEGRKGGRRGNGRDGKVMEKEDRHKLCLGDRKVTCKITFLQFLERMAAYMVHRWALWKWALHFLLHPHLFKDLFFFF